IERYEPRAIQLRVQAHGRGLLVLSELFYPGWRAEVNGRDVGIVEVNRALRGIPVPAGESRVVVSHAPHSVAAGAALTLASFCALPFALVCLRRSRRLSRVTP
ncbi:MAG TPA: YfhO family protein, partial [Bryobacteraceae bacterium]|nr:YfhO family protein [Bryobacteraceae bacterium]